MKNNIDIKSANEVAYLAVTAITNAGSGHPGVALGASPMLYTLLAKNLKFSNKYPEFFNRDRVVLCAGHVSTLYYSLLHLFGFGFGMDDLKNLRKFGSIAKGHPTLNPKLGIDCTAGPLGQGLPAGVGFAIAETILAEKFNRPGFEIFNHYTYVFASDGSLMEGITNEASSLAGTLELSKLIVLYDSNNITLDGGTAECFTEDVIARYRALGWNTLEVDGEDISAIERTINVAKNEKKRPTLIKVNTIIGRGSPLAGTHLSHGKPLSIDELQKTKQNLGIVGENFTLDRDVLDNAKGLMAEKTKRIESEMDMLEKYSKKYPLEFAELGKWLRDEFSKSIDWEKLAFEAKDEAGRRSSYRIINTLAPMIPNFVVGSADLSSSANSNIEGGGIYSSKTRSGRNIQFGVREHAMASICNGIALHGGLRVLCSTFVSFSDYMRHAIRMASLMKLPVIYVLTHDSIGVGSDGATHQPIEYNTMFRSTPGLNFVRPADSLEVLYSYKIAFDAKKPTILCLSRQANTRFEARHIDMMKGAYAIKSFKDPHGIIVATGSEVGIAVEASEGLEKKGICVNVVSMPCENIFDSQTAAYKEKILPKNLRNRLVVEAGSTLGWFKYAGLDGRVIGIDEFGQTGDGNVLLQYYGFTAKNIIETYIKSFIKR